LGLNVCTIQAMKNTTNSSVDDPFWLIALEDSEQLTISDEDSRDEPCSQVDDSTGYVRRLRTTPGNDCVCNVNDSVTSSNSGESRSRRSTIFEVPVKTESTSFVVPLRLSSLPQSDDLRRPLGAVPWYGSALLASLFLHPDTFGQIYDVERPDEPFSAVERLRKMMKYVWGPSHSPSKKWSCLEIGSGAIGLVGLSLALSPASFATIWLTDNDPDVLAQLRLNVKNNTPLQSSFRYLEEAAEHGCEQLTRVGVALLDWYDNAWPAPLLPENSNFRLVVGSELIYSQDTAEACASITHRIFQRPESMHILMVIVQVADRDGWSNVFLPLLRSNPDLLVAEQQLVDSDIHQAAAAMIPHGGSLDRFDFSVCFVCRRRENSEAVGGEQRVLS
jgi:Lysine methyltransferase